MDIRSNMNTIVQPKSTAETIYVITQYSNGEIIYQYETTIKPTTDYESGDLRIKDKNGNNIFISGIYNVDSVIRKEE